MDESDSQFESPLDRIAAEYVDRWRRGERPAWTEYSERYPELADEIRLVFPALIVMERARPEGDETLDAELAGVDSNADRRIPRRIERLGDYRVLREIGRGGMGIVYEAEQLSLGRRVALKILPPQAVLDERHLQRFLREARAAGRLHHTNIVPVFGVGESDGTYYYVMQYIRGRGLDEVLREIRRLRPNDAEQRRFADRSTRSLPGPGAAQRPSSPGMLNEPDKVDEAEKSSAGNGGKGELSVATATAHSPDATAVPHDDSPLSRGGTRYYLNVARIGAEVAEALGYAAAQGVLHRDIKPSNLLIDAQGTVWITDFGLAKASDSDDLTNTGDILGTLRYLAPERLRGEIDLRGDLYSLGITLYELLALRPAFAEPDRHRLMSRILEQEPTPLRKIDSSIPVDLETIIHKAVAKDPAHRYQTAEAMASDLRQFIADRPIGARRVHLLERSWRWCRRNRMVASLTGVVLALLVAVIALQAVSNWRVQRETRDKEHALRIAQENELLARQRYYAAQLNLAAGAFHEGQLARVVDLLQTQRPNDGETDLRGFEWGYLWHETHRPLVASFHPSREDIWCLEFAPDGQTIAAGGTHDKGGFLSLWEARSGRMIRRFDESELDTVAGIAFAQDGRLLASGSADRQVRIWDVERGTVVRRFESPAGIRSLRWHEAQQRIAVGCQDGVVRIFHAETGELQAELETLHSPILGLAFSPDGQRLYSSIAWGDHGRQTHIHDLSTTPPRLVETLERTFVTDAASNSDRVAAFGDNVLRVWSPGSEPRELRIATSAGWLNPVRFSADGKFLATAGFEDRLASVWDATTGSLTVRGPHGGAVQVTAFDPRGELWASGTVDGEVKVWKLQVANRDGPLRQEPQLHAKDLFASPTKSSILVAGLGPTAVWTEMGERRAGLPIQHLRAMSRDGRVLAAAIPAELSDAPATIEIWDANATRPRLSWKLPDPGPIYSDCVALSPDGRLLATRGIELPLRLWDVSGAEPRPLGELQPADCLHFDFSPDGQTLAAACQFGRVRQWDVRRRTLITELQGYESGSNWAMRVRFSNDGQYVAAGNQSGVVRVWRRADAKPVAVLRGHLGELRELLFLADGKRLATVSGPSIRLWEIATGQELLTLSTPDDPPQRVVQTVAGDTLASLHMSGALRLWHSAVRETSIEVAP